MTNGEAALHEYVQRLKQKLKMTPEAFYRSLDVDYKKKITCDHFKQMLVKHDLQLGRRDQNRLCLILDEDLEGNITLEEYNDALEAYNCTGEKRQGSIPFE
jgi:hypothetical protein